MKNKPWIIALCLLMLSNTTYAQDNDVRPLMWNLFEALSYLLPLSLQEKDLDDNDQRLLQEQLRVLESSGTALKLHAGGQETDFYLLADSFDETVQRVRSSFERDNFDDAYYVLSDMTQNCVACHTQLPDQSDFAMGQKLFARMNLADLTEDEITHLYIATRQFDLGLSKFEQIILDPAADPITLNLEGIWIDYMQLALVVSLDIDRVRKTINTFQEREDLPLYIRNHGRVWLNSLDQIGGELTETPSLERARELFSESTRLTQVPAGRERAVHDIVAYSVLRRLLDQKGALTPEETAEAYYLLGLIALRTQPQYFVVPEMEFLLLSSVYAAPGSAFAERAYLLLEEFSDTDFMLSEPGAIE